MRLRAMFLHPGSIVQSIGLNIVRALSIISLFWVMLSTIIDMNTNAKAINAFEKDRSDFVMVDCEYIDGSSVPNQFGGIFWAFMASLLIIFATIFLALSEVGWNTAFFDRHFPVLGSNFGLGILGAFQCLLSTQILSHFVEDFTLVSSFVLFIIGCINILLGLILGASAKAKRSINRSRNGIEGVLPTSQNNRSVFHSPFTIFSRRNQKITPYITRHDSTSSSNNGLWPRMSTDKDGYEPEEKSTALGEPVILRPDELQSLPKYSAPPQAPVSAPTFRSSPIAI